MKNSQGCFVSFVVGSAIGLVACVACVLIMCSGIRGCITAPQKRQQAIDQELSEYARQEVPELQELIDTITAEIADRENRLRQLEEALAKVNKDRAADEEYKRWSGAIHEMEKTKEDLIASRDELYLAFRKYELAPSGTQASAERREAIAGAKSAVELTRELFLEQMKEIETSP